MLHLQQVERLLRPPAPRQMSNQWRAVLALVCLAHLLAAPPNEAARESGFRFTGLPDTAAESSDAPTSSGSLVWQPLRATFRPLNRATPAPPEEPAEPAAPAAPETAAPPPPAPPTPPPAAGLSSLIESADSLLDDEQPTRVPLSRFRPTKAPSSDPAGAASGSHLLGAGEPADNSTERHLLAPSGSLSHGAPNRYQVSAECFECICEASTNCNTNSRCQTSDVRHTRCGLFLISYEQWLDTGLSKELVSREALAKDPAADERAFYECVTNRACAERLLAIYMLKHLKDCDKDGRMDCYDVAAIHQGGPQADQCQSEPLLESQYWSDFNACFGFGARR